MPEGPSIVILKELVEPFTGKEIVGVGGNTRTATEMALHRKVVAFRSWGKHFLICFDTFTIRIHFLLFGSYRINEEKGATPRLKLVFENGVLNMYSCSVKIISEDLDTVYDWPADIMSPVWDAAAARKKLRSHPDMLVCDALLDQDIFAGSGNIIKNEVLFRTRIHPLSKVGALPAAKLRALVQAVRDYSFDFLAWKKAYTLKKHWQVHTKSTCPRCGRPLEKTYPGKTKRRTFSCGNCQVYYGGPAPVAGHDRGAQTG